MLLPFYLGGGGRGRGEKNRCTLIYDWLNFRDNMKLYRKAKTPSLVRKRNTIPVT